MLGHSLGSSLVSISLYFILNLLVTVTNKQILSQASCPWLLTASHALTTFITTAAILRLQKPKLTWTTTATSTSLSHSLIRERRLGDDNDETEQRRRNGDETSASLLVHLRFLLPFSLLYTLNIALSNLALGLVTLTMHQTIRAVAPVITVLISIVWLGRSWREYPSGAYGAIGLTIWGVIIATHATSSAGASDRNVLGSATTTTTAFGFGITLLSAVLAVVKTILTNELQRPPRTSRWGLGLPSTRLVQYLALYAVIQTLLLASWTGEIKGLLTSDTEVAPPTLGLNLSSRSLQIRLPWPWLWLFNALAASMLNLASFEANKRCGPLSMAIAANMKQVVILLFLFICFRRDTAMLEMLGGEKEKKQAGELRQSETIVVLGSLMTALGSIWYAFVCVRVKKRQRRRYPVGDDWDSDRRGWKG
ncbi:uncharacterized protein Z519_01199 [Cladophialophora bantiana CBS 173.52]|uniref:Sugar phosphate transporter domain-containing protein n=1 Tax=Cladophialophora bantiana (strain ATCC 10958 / CBS 173.52 / CDC B-1940 / NIH 8579) TaxID=1442370 RepID=A0A0D2I346_CLAB1|nr:uncharacterized protein Z519_01199 [Cladophialophora bantiana CBS 173.52]KIW97615.1 hypothetical protein Z519_01199 [Cladophialophora bantiana CBS 173.52]